MAIVEGLHGVYVKVVLRDDAQREQTMLTEYVDNDFKLDQVPPFEALATTAKYIEATTDATFGISLAMTPSFEFTSGAISFDIYVDGALLRQPLVRKSVFEERGNLWGDIICGVKSIDTSGPLPRSVCRKFKFSEVKISSDDEKLARISEDTIMMSQIGEIVVKMFRRTEPVEKSFNNIKENIIKQHPDVVHEKALKGGDVKSHGVSLGVAENTKKVYSRWGTDYLDGEDKPIGVFRFKYRSKAALQTLHIIPRPLEMEAEAIPPALPTQKTVPEAATASQPKRLEATAMPDQGPLQLARQQQAAIEKLRTEQKAQLEKLEREQRVQLQALIKASKTSYVPLASPAARLKMEELLISDMQRDSRDNTGAVGIKQEHEHCGRVGIKRENEHVNGSSRKRRKMGTEKVPIVIDED